MFILEELIGSLHTVKIEILLSHYPSLAVLIITMKHARGMHVAITGYKASHTTRMVYAGVEYNYMFVLPLPFSCLLDNPVCIFHCSLHDLLNSLRVTLIRVRAVLLHQYTDIASYRCTYILHIIDVQLMEPLIMDTPRSGQPP